MQRFSFLFKYFLAAGLFVALATVVRGVETITQLSNPQSVIAQTTNTTTTPRVTPTIKPIQNIWSSDTTDEKRLRELETKYSSNRQKAVMDLQKKQLEELKRKREQVKANITRCDAKLREYKTSRNSEYQALLQQLKALRQSCQMAKITRAPNQTSEDYTLAIQQEKLRSSQCTKDLETQRNTFLKETRMKVVEIQKACHAENEKPAPTPTPNPSAVQGISTEEDEVPLDPTLLF